MLGLLSPIDRRYANLTRSDRRNDKSSLAIWDIASKKFLVKCWSNKHWSQIKYCKLNLAKRFVVDPGWQVILKDLGIGVSEVLTRAQLPGDLFSRKTATLNAQEYFRLWSGLEETIKDSSFPLRLGQAIPVELFNPSLFAALCSSNFMVGMKRLSQFKKLIGPITLDVTKSETAVTITIDSLGTDMQLPGSLVATELVFLVHLIRLATREHIIPVNVFTQDKLNDEHAYANYFGTTPQL